MSLYLKHRPTQFEEVIGNEKVINPISAMVRDLKTCPHSFLLHGPSGCGKTTIGRILATELGAVGNDYREVDSADFRGIDTIRELRKNAKFRPLEGPVRVYLIDECHKMTNDAQNALLKILEDTPKHVYFILCTTDPQKLIPTVKNRCQQFQVELLTDKQMKSLIRATAKEEGERVHRDVLEQITEDAQGHPRQALQVLEQVLSVPAEDRMELAKRKAEELVEVLALSKALLNMNGWKKVASILTGLKQQDPESIRRQVLGYAQAVLLKGDNDKAAQIIEEFMEPFYDVGFPGLTYACYSVVKG